MSIGTRGGSTAGKSESPVSPKPTRALPANSLSGRLVDWLGIEGGWWPTSLIYDRFPQEKRNTVYEALKRLRRYGMVESRPMPRWKRDYPETEWRWAK